MNKKIKSSILIIVFVISITNIVAVENDNEKSITINPSKITTDITTWYEETISMWVSPEGYIWSDVGISGYPLNLGELSTQSITVDTLFINGGLSSRQANNPWDNNIQLDFTFMTNNPDIAEAQAQIMVNVFNSVVPFNVEFVGSHGSDQYYDSSWVQATTVSYTGHVDWTNMANVINESVPRDKGGLAETIDVFAADNLNYWIWNQGDGSIGAEISLGFDTSINNSIGGHSFAINDLIHTSQIKKSPYSNSDLRLWVSLPDVSNPAINPSNDTHSTIYWDYHPSPENQNRYNAWSADFRLFDATIYTNLVLSFDYEFIQQSWINRERYSWNIDPRGFDEFYVEATGKDRMRLTTNIGPEQSLVTDIYYFSLRYDGIYNSVSMQIEFYGHGDRTADIAAIISEINAELGFDLSVNNYENINTLDTTWDWENNQNINVSSININKDMTGFDYESVVRSTYGYNTSAFLANSSLTLMRNFEFNMRMERFGLGPKMSLWYNQIDHTNSSGADIVPSFDRVSSSYFVDLYNPSHVSWTNGLPWNNYTERVELQINGPYTGNWETDISYGVDTNNGLYWDSSRYTSGSFSYNKLPYFYYFVNIYDKNPIKTDELGNPITPINNFNVTVQNQFKDWNYDYEAPRAINPRWRDTSFPDNGYDDANSWTSNTDNPFSGTIDLVDQVMDIGRGGDYYNGTHWVPKFPGSGIQAVNITMFRTDAAVNNDRFTFTYPLTNAGTWPNDWNSEAWTGSIDTTALPDGEWQVWTEVLDNSDNFDRSGQSVISLSNYNNTQNATIDTTAFPAELEHVSDYVYLNWTVTDDLQSFVTILWIGLGGYIVDPYQTVDNGNGTFTQYFSYEFDTIFEIENREMSIFIETLDMNGNWIQSSTHKVIIDNFPIGNPPTINYINVPTADQEFNASVTPEITFVVEVLDDVGIEKVVLNIGDKSFNMEFNTATGYYESILDITTWIPGVFNWYVEVVDLDENTHTVTSEYRDLTLVGDGPLVDDVSDPVITMVSPSDGDTVSGNVVLVVSATDDTSIQNVVVTLPDDTENVMNKNVDEYSFEFFSGDYADNTYQIIFKATDISGKTSTLTISLYFDNGRTDDVPDLGLPGFEFVIAIFAFVSVIFVRKRY